MFCIQLIQTDKLYPLILEKMKEYLQFGKFFNKNDFEKKVSKFQPMIGNKT